MVIGLCPSCGKNPWECQCAFDERNKVKKITVVGDKQNVLDEAMLKKMNALANGFANERIEKALSDIESILDSEDISGIREKLWCRVTARKTLGRLLATAYSKGYADCYENVKVSRLII